MQPAGTAFQRVNSKMARYQIESSPEVRSALFERRRLRRIRMIVELTMKMISDPSVSQHEAHCLVDCARKAILELYPAFEDRYDRIIHPHFECALHERWPLEEPLPNELVN